MRELIEFLEYFNQWRRGADTEMPHPKKIGEAIDQAIEILKQVERETNQNP